MNQNSLSAYYDEGNQRLLKSHKARIIRYLLRNPRQNAYQIAANTGLTHEQASKRLTDSANSDIFEVCGNMEHQGNTVSLYKVKDQLSWIPQQKKVSLRNWLKDEYPDILFKYESLIEHKL